MVNRDALVVPAIGGCLRCHQLFLVTDASSACITCGRAPDVTLPFGRFEPAGDDVELVPNPGGLPDEDDVVVETWCPECGALIKFNGLVKILSVLAASPLLPVDEVGPEQPSDTGPTSSPAPEELPADIAQDDAPQYVGPPSRVEEILEPGDTSP